MALPSTAPKVNCTLSKPLMADGTVGTIKSASLKVDRDLVWVNTGETLYKESVTIPPVAAAGPTAGSLSFQVIPVDTFGVRDAAGNDVRNWTYTLRVVVTFAGNVERTVDYVFQPLTSDTLVDLDLVPHLNVTPLPPVVNAGLIDGGSL